MKWIKKGLIIGRDIGVNWSKGRAICPIPELISDNKLRIYFSTLDKQGRSTPIFIETNPETPEKIDFISDEPVLDLGRLGTFDDNGILVSSIVTLENRQYLYYIGWNPKKTVSYSLAIGLAISENVSKFKKISEGPILDRSIDETIFNTAPCVIYKNGFWQMWYVSCHSWRIVNDWPEPFYNVKYAVSNDGINWKRTGIVSINNDEFSEAVGKPHVYIENGIYKMIYSYRNSMNYRVDKEKSYRLGYAESFDGICWKRLDEHVGIKFSDEGWDSIMMEYASSYVFKGKRYLLYNGNGFGETGFGYAIMNLDND